MDEAEQEREEWNRRYGRGEHLERDPSPFLVKAYGHFVAPRFPAAGTALDVAGGIGHHAIWLAQRGWNVTLVDISDVGIKMALEEARGAGVSIHGKAADLRTYKFGREGFNLIIVFYFLERVLFPALAATLKPGGLIIYRTYTREHRKFRACSHPMHFLEPGELRGDFPGFEVLRYRESEGMAELVARKPFVRTQHAASLQI
ncbi:MAG TPA: methyltransferase domain-containing protein [Terriglobales bacterium]|nr:methyltransferase domain-containing protein [Terriglobales bacterium]